MTYLVWKFVHIASVILFVGNITTGVFWGSHANRSRDFRVIAATFDGIMRSDRLFTMPGVIGIVLSGVVAAIIGGLPILGTGWILWGIVLFSIAGIVFGTRVAPRQREIAALARTTTESIEASEAGWKSYDELYRSWALWGWVALLAPVAAVIIMVVKPQLPAF